MTLILKQIFSLLKALNSDTGENQIAAGITCGLILGFSPMFSLQTILVFIILFFFRVQVGAVFASAFFFAVLGLILDPAFVVVGEIVLESSALESLFIVMYNMPIIPFTKFNNSVVMGAAVVGVIISPLIFILSKKLIIKYRISILEKFKNTKFWKAVKATSFYKWYAKYDELYG